MNALLRHGNTALLLKVITAMLHYYFPAPLHECPNASLSFYRIATLHSRFIKSLHECNLALHRQIKS